VPSSPSDPAGMSADPRFKIAVVVIVLAALYALIQRTSLAPFSHTADDFVGGLATGFAIGGAITWFRDRR
jgi:hypothetical protein